MDPSCIAHLSGGVYPTAVALAIETGAQSLILTDLLDTLWIVFRYVPPYWPGGLGVRVESCRPWVQFPLSLWGIFQVMLFQSLRNGHSSGYPARHLVL